MRSRSHGGFSFIIERVNDLARLEEELTAALAQLEANEARAFALLAFAESDRAARRLHVDSASVRDQYERGTRLEWLLEVHRHPRPGRRCPRAHAFRASMLQAALDVRRRERQQRDPLYAHLERKYRNLATARYALWIVKSIVGRLGLDEQNGSRGDRARVVPERCKPLPPMPRQANERFVSRHDEDHAAFMRSCIEQAGGPLAHRQIIRFFLDAHGAASPIRRVDLDVDDLRISELASDADDEAWVRER